MSFSYQSIYFDEPIQKGRVLDIFTPKKINRDISLFFIHGGGWRAGSRADYHNLMRAFNEEGHVCAATDYRLQGVNLSEQLTDVRRGYDLFLTALRRMGRPERVVVYGGSAGALLAALVSMNGPSGWTTPVGVALSAFTPLFTPWEDIFPGIWSSMQDIAGAPYDQDPARYEDYSPIRHVSEATPPMFISHAENEHMFPMRNLELFANAMRDKGRSIEIKTYRNAEHGFFYDVTRRPQKEMFADMKTFLAGLES